MPQTQVRLPQSLTSQFKCPLCGGDVEQSRLLIDLNANAACLDGKIARLSPGACEFLYAVNEKYPASISYEMLESRIFGQRDRPDFPKRHIYVFAAEVRKVGRQIGYELHNTYTRGYRLVIEK